MGHRANYVIVERGEDRAYYDQWGALGSTLVLADGPDVARQTAETCEATDELLDWAFAEAGYLLDYDERRCIVFSMPEPPDPELREALDEDELQKLERLSAALEQGEESFLKRVAPAWTGWILVWDDRSVDAFAEHLAARSITAIKTQPPSHPTDSARKRVEVQPQ
jgi:hypothetical protein